MIEGEPMVAMVVDQDVCIGAGQCEMFEDEIFLVDDDTVIAGVIGSGRLPMDRAERVINACPSGAISIANVDDDSTKETE